LHSILKEVIVAGNGRSIWIAMETSLRSIKDARDVFDLDKCYKCVEIICESELYSHPFFLRNRVTLGPSKLSKSMTNVITIMI